MSVAAQQLKDGWELVRESIKVFNKHPKFIIPLLVVWTIYAPIVLYLNYWFDPSLYTSNQILLIVFGVVFVFAFLLSFSCSMLLELIQQLESGSKLSVIESFRYTVLHNTVKMLPLILVWAIIWFILLIAQACLPRRDNNKESFSAESAAKTLAGYQNLSLSKEFLEMLKKACAWLCFSFSQRLPGRT